MDITTKTRSLLLKFMTSLWPLLTFTLKWEVTYVDSPNSETIVIANTEKEETRWFLLILSTLKNLLDTRSVKYMR